jgi:hypothetical protein
LKMSLLNEEQTDEVFGGNLSEAPEASMKPVTRITSILLATVLAGVPAASAQNTASTPTLPTVNVTAPRLSAFESSFYWMYGGSRSGGYDGHMRSGNGYYCYSGSWCAPAATAPALPPESVPSSDKLRCIMDAVAEPGGGLRSDMQFSVVNSYAYYSETTRDVVTSQWPITPSPGYISISGLTVPTNPTSAFPYSGASTIYVRGMEGTGNANATYGPYHNDDDQLIRVYNLGIMTGSRNGSSYSGT